MKKLYYLSTCDTCKKIIKTWSPLKTIVLIDLKKNPINEVDLNELYKLSKSYEVVFNKRALLFREYKKKNPSPIEKDYKKLILTHYSYLKRPILIINDTLVAGNSEKSIKQGFEEIRKLI